MDLMVDWLADVINASRAPLVSRFVRSPLRGQFALAGPAGNQHHVFRPDWLFVHRTDQLALDAQVVQPFAETLQRQQNASHGMDEHVSRPIRSSTRRSTSVGSIWPARRRSRRRPGGALGKLPFSMELTWLRIGISARLLHRQMRLCRATSVPATELPKGSRCGDDAAAVAVENARTAADEEIGPSGDHLRRIVKTDVAVHADVNVEPFAGIMRRRVGDLVDLLGISVCRVKPGLVVINSTRSIVGSRYSKTRKRRARIQAHSGQAPVWRMAWASR